MKGCVLSLVIQFDPAGHTDVTLLKFFQGI